MAKSKHGREERKLEAKEYRKRKALVDAQRETQQAASKKKHKKGAAATKVTTAGKKRTKKMKKRNVADDNRPSFFEMAKANSAVEVDLVALQAAIEANQAKVAARVGTTEIVQAPTKPKTLEVLERPRMNGGAVFHRKEVRVMENFVDYLTEREKRRFLGAKKRKGKRPKGISLG